MNVSLTLPIYPLGVFKEWDGLHILFVYASKTV